MADYLVVCSSVLGSNVAGWDENQLVYKKDPESTHCTADGGRANQIRFTVEEVFPRLMYPEARGHNSHENQSWHVLVPAKARKRSLHNTRTPDLRSRAQLTSSRNLKTYCNMKRTEASYLTPLIFKVIYRAEFQEGRTLMN